MAVRPYICHILFLVVVLLVSCADHDHPSPQQPVSYPAQNPETNDALRQSAMASNFFWLVASNDARNPIISDDELIRKFQTHRAMFEQLRQMIAADPKLQRVGYDWTMPKDPQKIGVSPERIQEYRKLLDQAGCHRGFVVRSNSIYFYSAAQGIVTSSRDQGFYYSEATPRPIVANTLKYRPGGAVDSWKAFRHIDGNWYICFAMN